MQLSEGLPAAHRGPAQDRRLQLKDDDGDGQALEEHVPYPGRLWRAAIASATVAPVTVVSVRFSFVCCCHERCVCHDSRPVQTGLAITVWSPLFVVRPASSCLCLALIEAHIAIGFHTAFSDGDGVHLHPQVVIVPQPIKELVRAI